MFICAEYLHISHSEFEKLPRDEKYKWYVYVQEKSKYHDKERKALEQKRKAEEMKRNAPKSPGIQNYR
jgi:hypothetical protein